MGKKIKQNKYDVHNQRMFLLAYTSKYVYMHKRRILLANHFAILDISRGQSLQMDLYLIRNLVHLFIF